MYAVFAVLDLFVAPDHFETFLWIRTGVVIYLLSTVLATYTEFARRHISALSFAALVVAAGGIVAMTAPLGGFVSDYYIGIMLVLFVVGFFLPWSPATALAFCVSVIVGYLATNLTVHGPSTDMLNPFFFLTGTAAFNWLATESSERTRRRDLLLRMQLEKANDELMELDEAKTRFFANVSHELRTPLMLILGPLENLLRRTPAGRTRSLLETMLLNSNRLLQQVNAILDFARYEAGHATCQFEEANLGDILSRLVRSATPYADRRGIELVAQGLAEVPDTEFDRQKMETVGANLLSNALKFTEEGGRVVVRGFCDGSRVGFEVEDTGVGIPADKQEEIFERFHQVDGGLSRKSEGTGLGLALVRGLIQLHKGEIDVRSEEGEGSTFRVLLPREGRPAPDRRRKGRRKADRMAQAHFEALLAEREREQPEQRRLFAELERETLRAEDVVGVDAPQAPEGAPRILVVENNHDLRSFLYLSLAERYHVETTCDGVEGLEAARRRPPDLILSDVMMPNMDGYELCRRVRRDPALMAVPVILLTAKSGRESVVEGLEIGADDYVTKPFDMRELEARIEAHMRAKSIERALHERESRLSAIGQMTSALAHDLRGPLAIIVGHVELVRMMAAEDEGFGEVQQDLDIVRKAANRASRMIQEVVDFARGGGAQAVHPTPTPLGPYLEDLVEELRPGLDERGIALDLDRDAEEDLLVSIDRDQMHRVFDNLVANARDALAGDEEATDPRITIEARGERDVVALRVRDNGPGIPEDLADRLFQPFETRDKDNGTGLGLSIVRNLVAAHGGTVKVEQSGGRGAVFKIRLPRAVVADGEGEAPERLHGEPERQPARIVNG
ncbi:MAG: ATP-binding protein [Myxococcota bacterium]